jgi:uncharacterized protein YbjQ (UPF0145 family)
VRPRLPSVDRQTTWARRAIIGSNSHESRTHDYGIYFRGPQDSRTLGVVRGIIVRSRSIVGNIGASLQTLLGGNISLYTNLCERARSDAFDLMLSHAEQLGANAVIGIRYDATEVMAGVTEVLCYGTAVVVETVRGNI